MKTGITSLAELKAKLAALQTHQTASVNSQIPLSGRRGMLWVVIAAVAFHLAYAFPALSFLIALYLAGLIQLAQAGSPRRALHLGMFAGLAVMAPQLNFFWTIFGPLAIGLWMILAFWLALFVWLTHLSQKHLGRGCTMLLMPIFWTGLEYFRSEAYYLRFSWISPAYSFALADNQKLIEWCGAYGSGCAIVAIIGLIAAFPHGSARPLGWIMLLAFGGGMQLPRSRDPRREDSIKVAGIQLEFPAELEVPLALDQLLAQHPDAKLLMLSEYTFDGPVPERVKQWCKLNQRFLVVGGKAPLANGNFLNTAFVIGPDGTIVFQQAKSVPIQFFADGLPAPEQKVWESPWGKLGICICYDLSYTQVTDALVRQGAQALLVPTMDVTGWGAHQHRLHERVAPTRAAEYGIPIFKVASSGVSQIVESSGKVSARAEFPGQGEIIAGELHLTKSARLPWGRWFAPLCSIITAFVGSWLAWRERRCARLLSAA